MGGVTVLHGDKGYMLHKGSNVAMKIDAWIVDPEGVKIFAYTTVVQLSYKENNVYNTHLKPRGNKTDAMPLSEDSDNRSSRGLPAGSEPVRPENPDPEKSRRSTRSNARWCDGW